MKNYNPPSAENWNGRKSDDKAYWHENIRLENLRSPSKDRDNSIRIIAYACDEGVRRNLGRVGAVNGPNEIRNAMAKMAWHLKGNRVYDCGNIVCLGSNMEEAQESLAISIDQILSAGSFPIVLGGGHDMAYGHYNGIRRFEDRKESLQKIGIINFDAHFDLRKLVDIGNSGTPFYQIAQEEKAMGREIHYLPVGIQREANTVGLFETAKAHNVDYILSDEIQLDNYSRIDSFIQKVDVIYVTVDMDVFSSASAPGVSSPSPMGCSPQDIVSLLKYIIATKKVVSADIAELNPLYDRDDQTAKLASRIVSIVAESHFCLPSKR